MNATLMRDATALIAPAAVGVPRLRRDSTQDRPGGRVEVVRGAGQPGGGRQFEYLHWHPPPASGCPVLEEGLAALDCVVTDVLPGGDHSIFLGLVVDLSAPGDGEPLLFFDGRYRRLLPTRAPCPPDKPAARRALSGHDMTCYLRLHEIAVGVRPAEASTGAAADDWDAGLELWRRATSADDRDRGLAGMPVDAIDVYDLPTVGLEGWSGLILSGRVDQELLHRERDRIRGFLDTGKVVVFSGQLISPWLPGVEAFVVRDRHGQGEEPLRVAAHPIFDGVKPRDLGGSFVYRHGHHPSPAGAQVVVQLAGGRPALYVDRVSSGGTILVHGGTNLLAYATADTTARRIVPQLLSWIRDEARQESGR